MLLLWARGGRSIDEMAEKLDREKTGVRRHLARLIAEKIECPEICREGLEKLRKQASAAAAAVPENDRRARIEAGEQLAGAAIVNLLRRSVGLFKILAADAIAKLPSGSSMASGVRLCEPCDLRDVLAAARDMREARGLAAGGEPVLPFETAGGPSHWEIETSRGRRWCATVGALIALQEAEQIIRITPMESAPRAYPAEAPNAAGEGLAPGAEAGEEAAA